MKTFLICALLISRFNFHACFLPYPFVANDFLEQIFDTFYASENEINIEEHVMKHAIKGEKCFRECKVNDRQVCYFNFTLKHYQVMGGSCRECSNGNADNCLAERCVIADGVGRGYLALNFQLPGPLIQVCKNDVIVVDLHNEAEGLSTSIHWHGMRQKDTQFMDGVPYLTQCPIPYGQSFRYTFRAEDEGTHFYHSHSGQHKADGVYGPLIVRGIKDENPNAHVYDFDLKEHMIFMADWMHSSADNYMPGLAKRSSLSQSILINGHGTFFNTTTKTRTLAPISVFHVDSGSRYRFRLINAGMNVCPFLMQIEDHKLKVIATEVSYVEPIIIDSLYFMSGERFDFVIDTSGKPVKDYWIRFRQLSPCTQELQGFAILRYHEKFDNSVRNKVEFSKKTRPSFKEEYPIGTLFNTPFPGQKDLAITKLVDFRIDNPLIKSTPDKQSFIFFDTPGVPNNLLYTERNMERFMFTTSSNGQSFLGTANNISFLFPTFPLLLNLDRVNDDIFCNEHTSGNKNCQKFFGKTICRCTHRIKFKLNSIAELVLVNVADKISHPIHLHGHKFHVMDMGLLRENMTETEVRNSIPKINHKQPAYKDTVVLPYPGYVRIRFRANNPGFWLLHCHFDFHLPIGMAVMIQVGEVEQMRKAPDEFPRCHSYLPDSIV